MRRIAPFGAVSAASLSVAPRAEQIVAMSSKERRSTRQLIAVPLVALAVMSCQHPSSTPSPSSTSNEQPRLLHPEQLVIPPDGAEWPRPILNGQHPHYPKEPRSKGIEGLVLMALVINEDGRPEQRTISILQSLPRHSPEFTESVCTFLRTAQFGWEPHAPTRTLVVMPFIFGLTDAIVTQSVSREPDLRPVRDSLRQMSPPEIVAWIESKPHCF